MFILVKRLMPLISWKIKINNNNLFLMCFYFPFYNNNLKKKAAFNIISFQKCHLLVVKDILTNFIIDSQMILNLKQF
jgi:hypothetical protein